MEIGSNRENARYYLGYQWAITPSMIIKGHLIFWHMSAVSYFSRLCLVVSLICPLNLKVTLSLCNTRGAIIGFIYHNVYILRAETLLTT